VSDTRVAQMNEFYSRSSVTPVFLNLPLLFSMGPGSPKVLMSALYPPLDSEWPLRDGVEGGDPTGTIGKTG
jgi:hypothetical protein